jgi:hypothetical protein
MCLANLSFIIEVEIKMHEKQKLKELMTISGKTDFKPKVVKRD